jgi:hypothetical protein
VGKMLSEEELDDLASRAGLSRPVNAALADDEGVRDALASVRFRIESSAYKTVASRPVRRPAHRRRWVLAGVAVASVAAASLVGVNSLTGGSGGGSLPLAVSPAAAAQLDRIAHGALGWVGLGAGQWLYVGITDQFTGSQPVGGNTTVAYSNTTRYQTWTDARGDTRTRITDSDFAFATPQDRVNYEANKAAWDHAFGGAANPVNPVDNAVAFDSVKGPVANQFEGIALTSDPQTLISEVGAAEGRDPLDLQTGLTEILYNSASARLRSTAFAALAYVPGTKVLGNRTDARGRPGVAISFNLPNESPETMIVDPSTGDILEDLTTGPGARPAQPVTNLKLFDRPAVVDSDTALPGGGTLPVDTSANTATSTNPAATSTTPGTSTSTQ